MLMPIKYLACEKTNRELQDIIQILIEEISATLKLTRNKEI